MNEYILCSAIHVQNNLEYAHQPTNIEKGLVITGYRHCNCFVVLKACALESDHDHVEQGFLTNTNKFVDRRIAYEIAKNANQIINPQKGNILYSENLY